MPNKTVRGKWHASFSGEGMPQGGMVDCSRPASPSRWDLDQIRDVLLPRVLQSSTDQHLVEALVEFDSSRQKLHGAIIAHRQAVTHGVFPYVIDLLEQAQALYSVLCENWR